VANERLVVGMRCKHAGVRPSMGSVGDAYDKAPCESFFATLECELIDQHRFRNQAEARMAVFDIIEGWYNPHRRHSGLGQKSPLNFESESATEHRHRNPGRKRGIRIGDARSGWVMAFVLREDGSEDPSRPDPDPAGSGAEGITADALGHLDFGVDCTASVLKYTPIRLLPPRQASDRSHEL